MKIYISYKFSLKLPLRILLVLFFTVFAIDVNAQKTAVIDAAATVKSIEIQKYENLTNEEKAKLIESNQELYNKMRNANIVSKTKNDKPVANKNVKKEKLQQNNAFALPPDAPKYIDTGNREKDILNYNKAKRLWIKKNPEVYKQIKEGKFVE